MTPSHGKTLTPGPCQPPRKSVAASIETVNILTYSAMKKSANLRAEYSVWKPATSSVSASGRSNGTRLVSAIAEIRYVKKPMICGTCPAFQKFQMFQLKPQLPPCCSTIE